MLYINILVKDIDAKYADLSCRTLVIMLVCVWYGDGTGVSFICSDLHHTFAHISMYLQSEQ